MQYPDLYKRRKKNYCARMSEKVLFDKENQICAAFDLIICLKQIETKRLLLTCASFSHLPYNMSTLGLADNER